MNISVGNLVISAIVSIAFSALTLNWLITDEVEEMFFEQSTESNLTGIKNLKINSKNNNIYLNVYISKPLTCKEVIDILEIKNLPFKGKIYSPHCEISTKELVIITYIENKNI